MVNFDFNWKYLDYEIRCSYTLNDIHQEKPYIDLVKWEKDEQNNDYCFSLAYYKWDDEGGKLIFVGDRPFKYIGSINIQVIWKQLWLACDMLQDYYEKEYERKNYNG